MTLRGIRRRSLPSKFINSYIHAQKPYSQKIFLPFQPILLSSIAPSSPQLEPCLSFIIRLFMLLRAVNDSGHAPLSSVLWLLGDIMEEVERTFCVFPMWWANLDHTTVLQMT